MNSIKCMLMRAGTSKGAFLDHRDIPENPEERDKVLLRIMGSPDIKQIDGLGGATNVTSKVAIVQPSGRKGVDVDYFFAQVFLDSPVVDTKPTCGNMLAGVAPFAIERGWVKITIPETKVIVYSVNTDSLVEIYVQTPGGKVNYTDGDVEISGVPGKGAPILMGLTEIAGGNTGKLFPTGLRKDIVNNLEVSLVDAGTLMMLVKAESLGLNGSEGPEAFEKGSPLMEKIEDTRKKIAILAGLGDVSKSVIPKVGILSPARIGGTIKSQYLTPFDLHPSHAVTGAICVASACRAEGTVAFEITGASAETSSKIIIEHPAGTLPVQLETSGSGVNFTIVKAGTLRTARKIMDGELFY